MNGFHQVRVTGKRLEGRRVIALQEVTDVDLLHIKINALQPSDVILEVTPDPLNGVQLWTVGWQPHAPDMLRPPNVWRRVCTAVIQQQDVQAVGERLAEGIKQELGSVCVQIRELQEAAYACRGGHSPIDVEPREDVLDRANRLDAACGQPSAAYGQQANTAFVLATYPQRAGVLGWHNTVQLLLTGRLKRSDGVRVFWCGSAAAP